MIVDEYISPSSVLVRFTDTNEKRVHTTWRSFKLGTVKSLYDKPIYGIGFIGNGTYRVTIDRAYTPQYLSWYKMIQRCYDEKHLKRNPSYIGCAVCEEWLNFQNFAAWYDQSYYQVDGERMCLDKDILVKGNKVYSPDTCVFAPHFINCLFIKKDKNRGSLPLGVSLAKHNKTNPYNVHCSNIEGKVVNLGYYNSPEAAFHVYKTYKEDVIKQISQLYQKQIPNRLFEAMNNYNVEFND